MKDQCAAEACAVLACGAVYEEAAVGRHQCLEHARVILGVIAGEFAVDFDHVADAVLDAQVGVGEGSAHGDRRSRVDLDLHPARMRHRDRRGFLSALLRSAQITDGLDVQARKLGQAMIVHVRHVPGAKQATALNAAPFVRWVAAEVSKVDGSGDREVAIIHVWRPPVGDSLGHRQQSADVTGMFSHRGRYTCRSGL